MLGKPVYDPVAGRYIGYDCAVYADSLLGPGSVFGVEALAQGIVGDPAASLPRLHTATTFTQTTVLMLPLSVLRACTLPHAKLSKEIEGLSTQRYAELACIQQGLSRTPIFSTLPPLKLLALAKHFTLKILEPADRIATEGERFSAFVVLLHGKLIISKRTAWGRMRKTLGANTSGATVFGGRKQQAEIVVKSMRHGDKMPFVGESVLSETKPREQRELEVAPTTVRAAERTTVLYLPRDAAALFNMEWDQFSDLLLQRQQVLMQNSMHNVAMTAAIDKHKEDLANPSPELMEALALAKKANHRRPGARFRNPPPPKPPHPHVPAPTHEERMRSTMAVRQTMLQGMQVYKVATSMGLTTQAADKATPFSAPPGSAAAVGGGAARRRSSLTRSATAGGRLTMAQRAQGELSGNLDGSDRAGGRFLDAMFELQSAKKVLAQDD